jgi:serine/threonine protein kinase
MPSTVDIPDRYADPQLAGRGGMGDIWRVRDTELGREVVLKLLRIDLASDPQIARRFRREARSAARLSHHPHVVTVYDVGEHDGQPFIVMELLPGGTVADRVRAGTVTREDALRWIDEAADALDAAHDAGIVHRDVKPGNLLLDEHGAIRIADFGIARAMDAGSVTRTSPGTVLGTAGYLSPEQASGEEVGPASDNYSLAVVAWELLSGRRPYERDSFAAEAAAHVHERIPSLRATVPDERLPPAVDRVFRRALAKRPDRRFRSARAFAHELRASLDVPVAEPPTVPLLDPAATTMAMPTGQRRDVDVTHERLDRWRSWARTRDGRVYLLVPVIVFVLALAIVALNDDDGAPPQRATSNAQITATPATEQSTTPATQQPANKLSRKDAIALHEQAFRLIQQGRFAEALPLAQQALDNLEGVSPYEAYASYNVGVALLGVGRCSEALPYLDRSEQLQGQRDEIDAARSEAQDCLAGSRPHGGKAKGRHKQPKHR